MRHANSTALLTYWNRRRGNRPYPARSEIEPADIAPLLPDILIGETMADGERRFRLAGTGICNLFGRELKGTPIADLWLPERRRHTEKLLEAVGNGSPAILALDGLSHGGRTLRAEALLLPLSGPEGRNDRILGLISVFQMPYWVGHDAVAGLSTTGFGLIDPVRDRQFFADSPRSQAASPTQKRGPLPGRRETDRFVLLEGGRGD